MLSSIFKKIITHSCIIIYATLCFNYFGFLNDSWANDKTEIIVVENKDSEDVIEFIIKGTNIGVSTIYELPSPDRIVIDIANASLAGNFKNQFKSNLIRLQIAELKDVNPQIIRFELYMTEKLQFQSSKDQEGIKISIRTKHQTSQVNKNDTQLSKSYESTPEEVSNDNKDDVIQRKSRATDKIGNIIGGSKNIDKQLPEVNPLDLKPQSKSKAKQMEDAFNLSAYNKERISVEFQKMDLHNVFNFLRQVSGVNIVVDESVQGSLTLVLDEVPWDFALDIILNLKDLEKEERYNTIVIYPKKKEFKWPDQSKNNLSFKADSKVVEKESLIIKQQDRQSIESTEAKQIIAVGKENEKKENFEAAVQSYEKALDKWPGNSKLATKISTLYLVQLRQNAKSLFFAKIAIEKDPKNYAALLNAAIASANMHDEQKAKYYFNLASRPDKPLKEVLLSYATYNEDNKDYTGALQLLERHDIIYGEDTDSLISAARINDKIGKKERAIEIYRKLLSTGYTLPPDLAKYIQSRIAVNQ